MRLQSGNSAALAFGNSSSQFNDSRWVNEALFEGLAAQASDFRSLASMSLGSLAFSLTRAASFSCLSGLLRSTSLVKPLSWSVALLGEVSAFRYSNQILHPENPELWNDARAFRATLGDFIALKGVGHFLRAESYILRQFSQASGMVLGEYVGEHFDWRDVNHSSFLQRYAHALSSGIALEAGGMLTRLGSGGRLQRIETAMHVIPEIQASPQRLERDISSSILRDMASEASPSRASLNKAAEISKSWGLRDYQERMLVAIEQAVVEGDHSWLGLASPMQTGKSFLSGPLIELLQHYMPKETRYIVLSSSSTITRQSIGDLSKRFGDRLGRFDGDIKDYNKPITVASMFAFSKHLGHFDPSVPTVIINDEAYFTQSPSQRKIYEHFKLGEMRKRESGRKQWLRPCANRMNPGLVIGLSGTGAGLEDYHVPEGGTYNILDAIDVGWIRHLRGRRVVLGKNQIEYQEGKDFETGEQMIWWKPTINNARKLAQIYHTRLHEKGHRDKNLIYVPTIQHAELMQRALNGMYRESHGKDYAKVYHSDATKTQNDEALAAWELGHPVISIGMLSRGFRGEGAGAVFHTYQTDSIELFSQRTGRGWAGDPRVRRPDFYVLEVAWSLRSEFATLARVLGIVENAKGEFTTRGLREKQQRVKDAEALAEAVRLSASQAAAEVVIDETIFAHLPRLESWRQRMAEVLKKAGGVSHLAKATAIPPQVLNAYALGNIPTRLDHMIRLSRFWEDGISPEQCFVNTWLSVTDEWLAGGQGLAAPFVDAFSDWATNSKAPLALRANALDQILWNEFNHPVHTGRPLELSYWPFMRMLQSYWAATRGEAVAMPFEEGELWRLCKNEASTYVSSLAVESYAAIVQERLLTDSPTSVEALARRLKMEPEGVRDIEEHLQDELLYDFVRKYFRILPYSPTTPLSSFNLTGAAKDAFARLETLNDLLTCEPYDYRRFFDNPHMEDPLLEHNMAIGMNARLNPFNSGVQSQKVQEVFSEEIVRALQVRRMEYVGDVTTCPIAELRAFLGDEMVRKIQKRLGEYHLPIGRSATWYRPGSADLKLCLIKPLAALSLVERLQRKLPIQPLPMSAELRNALFDLPLELLDDFFTARVRSAWGKLGLEYIGDLVRLDAAGLAANETKIASTSTQKIRECLHRMGLALKMETAGWSRPAGKASKGLHSIPIAYFSESQQAFLRLPLAQSELPDALKVKLASMGVVRMADVMRLRAQNEIMKGKFHYFLEGTEPITNQVFLTEELELMNVLLATQQLQLPRPVLIRDAEVTVIPIAVDSHAAQSLLLAQGIDVLDLSTRSTNCLVDAGIGSLAELTSKTSAELLKTRNFGRKSLKEIKDALAVRGLALRALPVMEFSSQTSASDPRLNVSVEILQLSVRSSNALDSAGVKTLAELVSKTEEDLLKTRNFGRKSLKEIKDALAAMSLSLRTLSE